MPLATLFRALALATALLAPAAAPAAAAMTPSADPVEAMIRLALMQQQVDALDAIIEITASSPRPPLEPGAQLDVERFTYQPAGRRFYAVLATVATEAEPAQRFTVAGQVRIEITVPVLARRMVPGDVIGAADLQWLSVGDRRVPSNTLHAVEDIIGLSPRRTLAPGRPLLAGDLKRPALVSKGAPVLLVLRTPTMQLTARGQALEDGAEGAFVRVSNAHSRTVIAGRVLPNGQVEIEAVGFPPRMEARR